MSPAHTEITRDEEDGQCVHFFCIDDTEASWVATALIIGAFVSGLFAGPAMSKFGRKGAMIMYFIFSLSGWFLLTFATEPLFLYIGRFMNGLGSGGNFFLIIFFIQSKFIQNFQMINQVDWQQFLFTLEKLVLQKFVVD